MKAHGRIRKIIAMITLLSLFLALLSCGKGSFTVYTYADGEEHKIEISLGNYGDTPTFYEVLGQDDTLEADLDEVGSTPRLISVCNVRAGADEEYRLFSSLASDAASDADPFTYNGMTFYPVADLFSLRVCRDASYLLILVEV